MTLRDELGFAASPAIEIVSAGKMQKIAKGFGRTRLIGMTTPGTNLTGLNGGISVDFPQSPKIRLCMVAKRATGAQTEYPQVAVNIRTRSETGGPSEDFGGLSGSGQTDGFPVNKGFDPVSWIESGRIDNWFDHEGFKFNVTGGTTIVDTGPHAEQIYWMQLSLITFFGWGWIMSPAHNKLWLNVTPEANIEYVRNVIAWEWLRHPETPTLTSGSFVLDKSAIAEGMGSKYDIFTGY